LLLTGARSVYPSSVKLGSRNFSNYQPTIGLAASYLLLGAHLQIDPIAVAAQIGLRISKEFVPTTVTAK
jgi:hypothetical protein